MLFLRRQSRSVSGTLAVTRPIWLSTSRTRLSPVMAAEQFLPPGKLETVLETVSFVDTTFGSAILTQSRSQRVLGGHHPRHAGLCQNEGRPLSRQSIRAF